MKAILSLFTMAFFSIHVNGQKINDSAGNRTSLDKATAAIRAAFEKGDAALVAKLHSPDIVKYFGGNNVVVGRAALEKGLKDWFQQAKVEFIENTVESTVFIGRTAIQTGIFAIKTIPKDGTKSSIGRGRSMVIYIRDESSPTGWLSLREMVQEAPGKTE
jgi:ketosteroid isomerase-like protein